VTETTSTGLSDIADVESWVWQMQLEEQLDRELLSRDAASLHRRRVVRQMRVTAAVVVVLAVLGLVKLVSAFGVGLAIVGVWALPIFVLGVVLGVEKLLLRLTH
jgi:hypothetical protein